MPRLLTNPDKVTKRWGWFLALGFFVAGIIALLLGLTVGWLLVVFGVVDALGIFYQGHSARQLRPSDGRELRQKGDVVKVDVIQNGPFETEPSGWAWYSVGSRIQLKAFPDVRHPFKSWSSSSEMIEVLNPASAETVAIVKGPGTITGNFY